MQEEEQKSSRNTKEGNAGDNEITDKRDRNSSKKERKNELIAPNRKRKNLSHSDQKPILF